jgi:hypothetical protein
MTSSRRWLRFRIPALVLFLVLGSNLMGKGEPIFVEEGPPLTLDQLQKMSIEELTAIFTQAELYGPFAGVARGRLLTLTDPKRPRLKVRMANSVWRGKAAEEDGHFINRWIGGVRWIGSEYVIGPSWIDGKPAVIMEYPPGTPLFANMHDELREICPGLFMGPIFERFPCPKLRGFIGLQLEEGKPPKHWRRDR